VEAVGRIAKELKGTNDERQEKFFWVLDPVMGDSGKLYVSELVVPVYRTLLPYADLITPNQYEVEWLTGIKPTNIPNVISALNTLHKTFHVPHVLISSLQLFSNSSSYTCVGSSMTSTGEPRAFSITLPMLKGPFVGTGDMFAALSVARFRQAATEAGLLNQKSWMSADEVNASELPLARAAELVLDSMDRVLKTTGEERDRRRQVLDEEDEAKGGGDVDGMKRVRYMKAAELCLVQSWKEIKEPSVRYKAVEFGEI